jgi:hypothetical protein
LGAVTSEHFTWYFQQAAAAASLLNPITYRMKLRRLERSGDRAAGVSLCSSLHAGCYRIDVVESRNPFTLPMPPTTRCREHAALHFHGSVRDSAKGPPKVITESTRRLRVVRDPLIGNCHDRRCNPKGDRCGRMLLLHPAAHFTIYLSFIPHRRPLCPK